MVNSAKISKICSFILRAQALCQKSNESEATAFKLINQLSDKSLSDCPTAAENAANLEEAISSFIHYGEYNITDLMDEIKEFLISDEVKKADG